MNSDRDPPAEIARQIEVYEQAVRLGADPAPGAYVETARQALRWFNTQLAELAPGPVDEVLAVALTRQRDWALLVLHDYGGGGEAKRQQLEVAAGRALAICTGGRSVKFTETVIGVTRAYPRGCFSIFEEKPNVSGKKWPSLCPDCQPANGRRNPYRTGQREAERRAKAILKARRTATTDATG